jgi:hypothetical protein
MILLRFHLTVEDDREVGMVLIDGVFYHFERIKKETWCLSISGFPDQVGE